MPNFAPVLDRRQEVSTGSHSGGFTTWTLAMEDPAINRVIISSGGSVGTVLTPTSKSTTYPFTVTVAGNYNGESAVAGILYTASVTPTPPVRMRGDGTPDFISRHQVRCVSVAYSQSAGFLVRQAMTSRADRTSTFAGNADGTDTAQGTQVFHLNGNTKDSLWTIESTGPKRIVVASAEFLVDINIRRDG